MGFFSMKGTTQMRAIRSLIEQYRDTIAEIEYIGFGAEYSRRRTRLKNKATKLARQILIARQFELPFGTRPRRRSEAQSDRRR